MHAARTMTSHGPQEAMEPLMSFEWDADMRESILRGSYFSLCTKNRVKENLNKEHKVVNLEIR